MKRTILLAILATALSAQSMAQSLTDKSMTFYGLDFSKARMVGEGFNDPANIKASLFNTWNGLFTVEKDKYDLYRPFKKDKIDMDFSIVEARNQTVDASHLVTNSDYSLSSGDAEAMVKSYDTKDKTGLGCVIVIESFNKTKVAGTMYVIFFDIASKKIILSKHLEGKAGGFGLKAYYGRTILNVLDECQSMFPKWVKGK